MLLPSSQELTLMIASLAVATLTASYSISSLQGNYEILVSHKKLEILGLLLGGVYLAYVGLQFAIAVALR